MKRSMVILFSILVILSILGIIYHRATSITYLNQRGSIPVIGCKLMGRQDGLGGPTIFIPGTKGSLLEQNGKKAWLGLGNLLPGGSELRYDPREDKYGPIGILDRIVILPSLIESSYYHRLVSSLSCGGNAYFYSYDWRLNPLDNIVGLQALVTKVREETGKKPSIIAHSMGGLITHIYMKDYADTIDRVVYVGVPFNSGLTFLDDIDQGYAVALNKTILSKAAIFSHPGSFALLPHQGSKLYKDADLMEARTWKENKLSVYADGGGNDAALESNLTQAKAFFAKLDTLAKMSNRFLFIMGNCQDTPYSVAPDGTKSFRPGDGRVIADFALPVEKDVLDKRVIVSCATHGGQLEDKANLDSIMDFLR